MPPLIGFVSQAMARRRRWILSSVALVLCAGCGGEEISPSGRGPAAATAFSDEEASDEARRCSDEMPFEPTYLPRGLEREPVRGPAPGGRPPDSPNQLVFHFRSNDDRAIEVRRPGTLFSELAQGDDAPTIHVLGEDTASFGPIEPGGDDFIVFIDHPPGADPEDQCSWFSLNEVGVSLGELKQVAEGLRETG